jgi:Lon protease-like protein
MSDSQPPLPEFTGLARLFPLPNLVFYPNVMQPLHVFEPRYRQMTSDALAGDRLIALVLLRPGWEPEYEASPAVHSFACLGQIVADQRLDDGRFNILLRGLSRLRIDHEVPQNKLYRAARVEVLSDVNLPAGDAPIKLRRKLLRAVPAWFPGKGSILDHFRKLLKQKVPLGSLCDIIAFALPLDLEFKQQLLEETDVEKRAVRLLDHLQSHSPPPQTEKTERKFPPEFSVN